MSNVIYPKGLMTKLPLSPELVLDGAKRATLTEVIVVGIRDDGTLYFAFSNESGERVFTILAVAQKQILDKINEDCLSG